jgi:hypothetical protein
MEAFAGCPRVAGIALTQRHAGSRGGGVVIDWIGRGRDGSGTPDIQLEG